MITILWQKLPASLQCEKVCLIVVFSKISLVHHLQQLELTEKLLILFPFCFDLFRYYQGSFLVEWQKALEFFGD